MNTKFTEFILTHEEFYNSLSDKNKIMISDLDEYKNLEVYTDRSFYTYLYIGIKNKRSYFYKCSLKYDPETFYMVVSDGEIITRKVFKFLEIRNSNNYFHKFHFRKSI